VALVREKAAAGRMNICSCSHGSLGCKEPVTNASWFQHCVDDVSLGDEVTRDEEVRSAQDSGLMSLSMDDLGGASRLAHKASSFLAASS
jgi:hypothetical protein